MDERDKVQILLKEYDALRAEILQRSGHRFALLSFLGAVGAYAFFVANDLSAHQIIVLTISALALLGIWWQLGNLIAECCNRIAHIEREVNSVAGGTLLGWEHERSGSKALFDRLHNARNQHERDRVEAEPRAAQPKRKPAEH
jgi:hypothetical protein